MSGRRAAGVVVFGIDGVRLDTLHEVPTPAIDAIAADGFLAPFDVCRQAPSDSGPAWTTVATGTLPAKHRVFGNEFAANRIADYPDFLTRAERAGAGRTFAAAAWPPILTDADGGPVYLGGGAVPSTADGWIPADREVADLAIEALGTGAPSAAFLYFGAPDEIARATGVSTTYRDSISRADGLVGEVVTAVRRRPAYDDEDWTFIVVTDHGHRDEGGHGGDSNAERTAWLAASGPDVPRSAPRHLGHADVAAHALHAVGVAIDPRWGLDGVPLHV